MPYNCHSLLNTNCRIWNVFVCSWSVRWKAFQKCENRFCSCVYLSLFFGVVAATVAAAFSWMNFIHHTSKSRYYFIVVCEFVDVFSECVYVCACVCIVEFFCSFISWSDAYCELLMSQLVFWKWYYTLSHISNAFSVSNNTRVCVCFWSQKKRNLCFWLTSPERINYSTPSNW